MAPSTPRPQSSSYPKFDPGNAAINLGGESDITAKEKSEESIIGADIPRRDSSDPSSSSSTSSKGETSSMQNLRGIFLSKEERERQGLTKKGEKATAGGATKSASVPGPLKSAMKPRSSFPMDERIPNTDPLPTDKEELTGKLNHVRAELQKLANRAEKANEWIEQDMIVLTRLTANLKSASESPSSSSMPSIRVTEEGGNESAPAVQMVTDQIMEANQRLGLTKGYRKGLERAVYWNREEFRRIEKAMGRKKSGQSGAVAPPARNVGFDDEERPSNQSQLGIAGGDHNDPGYSAGLEVTEAQGPLREQYARDRWTSGLSRLPTQAEWEDLFGTKTTPKK